MRLELTRVGLLVELANHYTTKGAFPVFAYVYALLWLIMIIAIQQTVSSTNSYLDETDCISHSTNTLGKGMNPIILSPSMDK